jgi:two-component system sensor histidine kinase BaeS
MPRSLRTKFIVLLLSVSAIALSAAFLLRELMIRDFRAYIEGEREDRVYWITAELEHAFEKHGRWVREMLADGAIHALLLGYEVRVHDDAGSLVMDTDRALATLSPLMTKRVASLSDLRGRSDAGPYLPYPLYIGGRDIGLLEVRFLGPGRDIFFIRQSGTFLLWSVLATGGIAVLLSVVAAGVLTRSIHRLARAAEAVAEGNLAVRVPVSGGDEVATLAVVFNRMAQSLENQEALRKKLITNVAHELRTPLSVMQGELEAMMDGVIPMDRKQIESLHEETNRLKKMIEGIEELARAQASTLTLRKQSLALRHYLEGIMGRMTLSAQEKGVQLRLDCDEDVTVHADPEVLSRIVLNLLTNALKATGPGGEVTVRAEERGPDTALEVVDTGAGIDPKDLPFIFERFFRSSEGGLGLGLAIVKELVEAHGGTVKVQSDPGKGSTFTVALPGRGLHNSS